MANAAYSTERETSDWLADREKGIGSSDAAAVCGIDPYKTPLEVYVSKTDGHVPTGHLPQDPAMRWGLLLEPAIARAYELDTGAKLIEPEPKQHRSLHWMRATADRIRDDGRLVEIKTASSRAAGWGDPGEPDGIPERIAVQVQHQLAVYDLRFADVAVLIDGRDFRIYPVARDESIIESLITIESEFWQHVERREPPDPDWQHASTPQLLNKLHKPAPGVEVSLPDDMLAHVQAYIDAGRIIGEYEDARAISKAQLIHAMKDAERGHVAGYTITRRLVERKAHEVKASSYVDFRIKQPKSVPVSQESEVCLP